MPTIHTRQYVGNIYNLVLIVIMNIEIFFLSIIIILFTITIYYLIPTFNILKQINSDYDGIIDDVNGVASVQEAGKNISDMVPKIDCFMNELCSNGITVGTGKHSINVGVDCKADDWKCPSK